MTKGRASFKQYAQKDVVNARKAQAKRAVKRRDWNVKAIKTMPAGTYEVMIMDGDLPFANAWIPRTMQTVLDANLIPSFDDPDIALEIYDTAAKPPAEYLTNYVHPDIRAMTCLHLMRLAPGVDYGFFTPQPSERELGPDGADGSVPGLSGHPTGSGSGTAPAGQPQSEQLVN